jgi:hypothetical protein
MAKPTKKAMDERVKGIRSPSYWIERHHAGDSPREIWVHALDLLEHVLKMDTDNSFYKTPICGTKKGSVNGGQTYLEHLDEAMQTPPPPDPEFENIMQDCFRKKKKYKLRQSKRGQRFNVGGYISMKAGDKDARPFKKYYKDHKRETAKTLVFEMCTPYIDRDKDYQRDRHKIIYSVALACEAKNIPCRVVGYLGTDTGRKDEGEYRFFVVIKDYNEKIYPGIWGALQSCATSNSFENSIMNYFVATKATNNGYPHVKCELEKYIPDDEDVLVINGRNTSIRGSNHNIDEYLDKIKNDWAVEGGYDGYKK